MSLLEARTNYYENYEHINNLKRRKRREKVELESKYSSMINGKYAYTINKNRISTFNKEYTNMSYNEIVGSSYLQYISSSHNIDVDKKRMSGMPVVKKTRIPVSLIIECLKEEIKIDDIASDYYLTRQQIIDSLDYVIDILNRPFNEDI